MRFRRSYDELRRSHGLFLATIFPVTGAVYTREVYRLFSGTPQAILQLHPCSHRICRTF